ncbi:MAG: hypothetical protein RIT14_1965 [Pseudomonadota bacterium]
MTKLVILLCAALYLALVLLGNGPLRHAGAGRAAAGADVPLAAGGSLPRKAALSPLPGPSLRVLPRRDPPPAPPPRPRARPPADSPAAPHPSATTVGAATVGAPPLTPTSVSVHAEFPATITAPNAHLRAAPDGMARIFGRLPQGARVLVLVQDGPWSHIRLTGIDGIRLGAMEGFVYSVLLQAD